MAEQVPYKKQAWQAARKMVLARDGGRCVINGPKCTQAATDVDHIIPWRDGGSWFGMHNLRASCKACNSSRSASQKHHAGWKRADTHIVLVTGYDASQGIPEVPKGAGDVVLEFNAIAAGLGSIKKHHASSHHAATDFVWKALLKELRRGELGVGRVWIFAPEADAVQTYPFHRLIDLREGGSDGRVESRVEPGRF